MDNDNEIILENSGVAPDHVGPIESKISELTIVPVPLNDMLTSTDGDSLGGSCQMVELEEPMPKTSVASWDDVLAKTNLLEWAKNESGSISKKALMKWFLDVDGGPAQDISAYRYPVGVVDKETKEPRYCPIAMDHSWDLADGSKTGIANRYIQKKIIFLKNREGFPLTAAQDDFVNRHMGDFFYTDNESQKLNMNHCHTPAGEPGAGQFCSSEDSGSAGGSFSSLIPKTKAFSIDVPKGHGDHPIQQTINNVEKGLKRVGRYRDAQTFKKQVLGNHKSTTDLKEFENISEEDLDKKVKEVAKNFGASIGRTNTGKFMPQRRNEVFAGDFIMYNAAPSVPGVLRETDEYIDVSVIPMREGVFTGTDGVPTLKLFDEFKNDAHWLEGQAILPNHTGPTEIVTYKHDRRGKILDVKVRPETRDVLATARYYKNKLAPGAIDRIKKGEPYDGSIAYTTNTVPISGDWTAPDGSKIHYNAVEKDGYHFYHFAEVGEGACSVSRGCGFLLNGAGISEDSMKLNGNFWEPAVLAYLEKLNNELIIAKGNDTETKRLKADIDKWTKLLDRLNGKQNASPIEVTLDSTVNDSEIPGENVKSSTKLNSNIEPLEAVEEIHHETVDNSFKFNSELNMTEEIKEDAKGMIEDDEGNKCLPFQMKDGVCQEKSEEEEMPKENSVQVEVTIPEEFTQKMNAAISENESLKSDLEAQTQKLNAVTAQVEELIQKQNESEESKKAAMEKRDFEAFSMRLNAANRTSELAQKHYEGFKENGWAYFDENPKILYNSSPITMKAMGVASSVGASELEVARKTLKKTLSGKA